MSPSDGGRHGCRPIAGCAATPTRNHLDGWLAGVGEKFIGAPLDGMVDRVASENPPIPAAAEMPSGREASTVAR